MAGKVNDSSLIIRILIGIVIGVILTVIAPGWTWIGTLGSLFVGALKAIAPILVFVLVSSALAQGASKMDRRFGSVIFYYMLTTFLAGAIAVVVSFLFPQTLLLEDAATAETIPQGIGEVMYNLLMKIVDNPVSALMNANYIGILVWAALLGCAMKRFASEPSRKMLADLASAVSQVVRWIINLGAVWNSGAGIQCRAGKRRAIFTTYQGGWL